MNDTKNIYAIFGITNANFFNINIEKDIPKFIQPYTVECLSDEIAVRCNATALDFFNKVHERLENGDVRGAYNIFGKHLNEPKENCLGYASSTNGKGLNELAYYAMKQILDKPFLVGEIKQIADLQLYVEQIMQDRISDIYTNVTRKVLNDYTIEQCRLYNMTHLLQEREFGPYWDVETHQWITNSRQTMLVINNKPILLTPKAFLKGSFGPYKMYRNVLLTEWIKQDLLKNESSLIRERKNGEKYITKKEKDKEVRKTGFIPSKSEMVSFASIHLNATEVFRKILEEYRNRKKKI